MLSFLQYRSPKCHHVNGLHYMCLLVLHIVHVITCLANTSYAYCDKTDGESLLSFSGAISSQPSLNWSRSMDCCAWEGVGCDENGWVFRLWLPSRGLVGSISPSITNLSYLSELNLSHNSLSGTLPDKFFTSLNHLQIIDLSYNRLQGELSVSDKLPRSILGVNISSNKLSGEIQYSFLQKAFSLAIFNVSNNSFTGTIPSFICSISPFMTFLDFSLNEFLGHIPKGFGECLRLETLRVVYSNLVGPIPNDIYRVSTLKDLSLAANWLSGPIDESIGNLTNLKILALDGNELTGKIPRNIGRLYKLEQLLLHINQLNGTIPFSLSNCSRLTKLMLRANKLEGELSAFDFSSLVQLRVVDLGSNHFLGSFPASLFSCKLLSALRLSSNALQVEIVPDIQDLQSLSFLAISNSSLTNISRVLKTLAGCKRLGTLIMSYNFYNESLTGDESLVGFDGFQNLQLLGLGGCRFTGEIPMWLSKLPNLEVLFLSVNRLSGPIPSWIANFSYLFHLDLSSNLLSGNFPLELFKLPRLSSEQRANQASRSYLELPVFVQPSNVLARQYNQPTNFPPAIYVDNNNLSGNIPSEIGQLKSVHVLGLNNNDFSGSIPDTISDINNLERLDLSGNHFSGEIPSSLRNLHFLSFFSVANNSLEGPIPTGGQFNTFPNTSFEGNPRLCGDIVNRSCSEQPVLSPNQPASTTSENAAEKIILYLTCGIGFGISFGISFFLSINTFGHFSTKCARSIISRLGYSDYRSRNQFRR